MRKGGLNIAGIPYTLIIIALIALISIFFIMNVKEGTIPIFDQLDTLMENLLGI
jgi:hypothetical protein